MNAVDSSALPFLQAMAGAAVVVAAPTRVGSPLAVAWAAVVSHSINPPSITASIPAEFPSTAELGVSVLTARHSDLAAELWDRVGPLTEYEEKAGVPLVPRALCALVCETVRRVTVEGRDIVVAEVTDTEVRFGQPLVWFRDAFYPAVSL